MARLLTQFEGACSRPLLKEVALGMEEMRREKFESFVGAASSKAAFSDVGEGNQSAGSDSSWAEVSATFSSKVLPFQYAVL